MKKSNKIILAFYVGLAISLISAYAYADSIHERPELLPPMPTADDPTKKYSWKKIVGYNTAYTKCFDLISWQCGTNIDKFYNTFTDVENYHNVLPKNVLSVEVIDRTANSITAIEELSEKFIIVKLTVKHSFVPNEKHTIEILDGDAQGTVITQYFTDINQGLQIITDVDLKVKGVLSLVSFLPKSSLDSVTETVIDEFVKYTEIKNILTDDGRAHPSIVQIDSIYREVLLRSVDKPAERYYVKLIEDEKITFDEIRNELLESDEYQRLLVLKEFTSLDGISPETKEMINKIFQETLERDADRSGLLYYSALFESGKLTLDDIRNELLESDEKIHIDFTEESE